MPERRAGDSLVAGCHDAIRKGSLSFAGAARLFDPETREAAYLLYAWCRHCDDQIDGERLGLRTGEGAEVTRGQRDRLGELVDKTRRALGGEDVADPAFRALRRVALRYGIPVVYPFELLEGFAMDVEDTRYRTLDDLLRYCYHVAGVVGLMMAHVMGAREDTALRPTSRATSSTTRGPGACTCRSSGCRTPGSSPGTSPFPGTAGDWRGWRGAFSTRPSPTTPPAPRA
jgi:phytoene/squalene synthetase